MFVAPALIFISYVLCLLRHNKMMSLSMLYRFTFANIAPFPYLDSGFLSSSLDSSMLIIFAIVLLEYQF